MNYNAVDFEDLEDNPIALTLVAVEDVLAEHGMTLDVALAEGDFPEADVDGVWNAADVFAWLGY